MTIHNDYSANTSSKLLSGWLFSLCSLIAAMVLLGGFVRLTHSGLSIVEWQIVTGVVPPVSDAAWQVTFSQYQQTPEYRHINHDMTLPEYKFIYFIEYFHRLLGRLTGLILVIPLIIFLARKTISRREAPLYIGIGLLFALQGGMGWYMVKSGLVDRPAVSPYRLTAHLLLALLLFALCFWLALDKVNQPSRVKRQPKRGLVFKLSLGLTAILVVQITYGGFMAGLKAGHVSATFPLMFGYLIPPDLLSSLQPWPLNLVANPLTVHFVHRWLGFVVLALIGILFYVVRKRTCAWKLQLSVAALLVLGGFQILLGIGVITWHVPLALALSHQTVALGLFALTLFINHQVVVK
ncbi:MAG: COX15/CtaA family protein [Anaerolineae bacterium]|nr:COX15/CtaA family protein [Anaerolineales bacterium]MCQ3977629.1 heme A synthase [Anaerolineae bacterium]